MADLEDNLILQNENENDHQSAFLFSPEDDLEQATRPSKRRKVSKKGKITADAEPSKVASSFVPLFNGAESAECAAVREQLFGKAWSSIETRIQNVLREVNRNTLNEVGAFVRGAPEENEKIPAAFIITGPNIASQQLLFEQLAESLQDSSPAKVVRLRSAEAPNLKGTLKKIIRDATSKAYGGDEDLEVTVGQDGRKYLDYDLEALHSFVKPFGSRRVIIAFQDTEAFDGSLVSDLILLFRSWRGRIQFTLLFGIATSVELFQARLLKSTAQHLYGGQFDVVQANSVLESVFKAAIAARDVTLRLGPGLLETFVERQREQVAGIQVLVSSVKYAYMCHFYANPLSVLLQDEDNEEVSRNRLQPEHLEAIRMLPSFKAHVEGAVDARQLTHALSLLDGDKFLLDTVFGQRQQRKHYATKLLQSLHLMQATRVPVGGFIDLYIAALSNGIDLATDESPLLNSIRRLQPDEVTALIRRLLDAVKDGSPELGVDGWASEGDGEELVASLTVLLDEMDSLSSKAKGNGNTLRNKYGAQNKVLRTTVVAQKVQLSQDTAKLTAEDKAFTEALDQLVELLTRAISCEGIDALFLNEIWVYDAKSPYRDVFIPRQGTTIERALSRPNDYLAYSCCSKGTDELSPSLPATAIVYHLYLEAGSLINVADLWSAFYALVGEESESSIDERATLVRFYQALAELKNMGFVKQSRKKADHIAKLKWL